MSHGGSVHFEPFAVLTAVYSTKGGVGTSSVAALLALASSGRAIHTTLVDLGGDAPAVLGIDADERPGYAEWSRQPEPAPGDVDRLALRPTPDLSVVTRGIGVFGDAPPRVASALAARTERVIIDVGAVVGSGAAEPAPSTASGRHGLAMLGAAHERLLVVRLCYLSLRSARSGLAQADIASPTGVVVVSERGRALARCDVESVIDAPVVAEIAVDPSVARAIDAGLLTSRPPRLLLRRLAGLFDHVAA